MFGELSHSEAWQRKAKSRYKNASFKCRTLPWALEVVEVAELVRGHGVCPVDEFVARETLVVRRTSQVVAEAVPNVHPGFRTSELKLRVVDSFRLSCLLTVQFSLKGEARRKWKTGTVLHLFHGKLRVHQSLVCDLQQEANRHVHLLRLFCRELEEVLVEAAQTRKGARSRRKAQIALWVTARGRGHVLPIAQVLVELSRVVA